MPDILRHGKSAKYRYVDESPKNLNPNETWAFLPCMNS
jgi:hypothetical protein